MCGLLCHSISAVFVVHQECSSRNAVCSHSIAVQNPCLDQHSVPTSCLTIFGALSSSTLIPFRVFGLTSFVCGGASKGLLPPPSFAPMFPRVILAPLRVATMVAETAVVLLSARDHRPCFAFCCQAWTTGAASLQQVLRNQRIKSRPQC